MGNESQPSRYQPSEALLRTGQQFTVQSPIELKLTKDGLKNISQCLGQPTWVSPIFSSLCSWRIQTALLCRSHRSLEPMTRLNSGARCCGDQLKHHCILHLFVKGLRMRILREIDFLSHRSLEPMTRLNSGARYCGDQLKHHCILHLFVKGLRMRILREIDFLLKICR